MMPGARCSRLPRRGIADGPAPTVRRGRWAMLAARALPCAALSAGWRREPEDTSGLRLQGARHPERRPASGRRIVLKPVAGVIVAQRPSWSPLGIVVLPSRRAVGNERDRRRCDRRHPEAPMACGQFLPVCCREMGNVNFHYGRGRRVVGPVPAIVNVRWPLAWPARLRRRKWILAVAGNFHRERSRGGAAGCQCAGSDRDVVRRPLRRRRDTASDGGRDAACVSGGVPAVRVDGGGRTLSAYRNLLQRIGNDEVRGTSCPFVLSVLRGPLTTCHMQSGGAEQTRSHPTGRCRSPSRG